MPLDRIAPITRATALVHPPAGVNRRPLAGQTLELVFDAALADDLLATTAGGLQLRLAGLAAAGSALEAGDLLLVKVLATSPRLELQLLDNAARGARPADPSAHFETDQNAMRPDQLAWLRQVVWQPPPTTALAANWRASLRRQLEGLVAGRAAAATAMPAPPPDTTRDSAGRSLPALAVPASPHPFQIAVYAWGGRRVLLRALAAEADGRQARAQCHDSVLALRVSLDWPGIGRVELQLQLIAQGVLLDLAVDDAVALRMLRDRLPAIVAAIARADLTVRRCRLLRSLPSRPFEGFGTPGAARAPASHTHDTDNDPDPDNAPQRHRSTAPFDPAAALAPALFHAAAEIAALLAAEAGELPRVAAPAAAPPYRTT